MKYGRSSYLGFGKYKNKTVRYVLENEPGYLIWAHNHVKWFKLYKSIYKEAESRCSKHLSNRWSGQPWDLDPWEADYCGGYPFDMGG